MTRAVTEAATTALALLTAVAAIRAAAGRPARRRAFGALGAPTVRPPGSPRRELEAPPASTVRPDGPRRGLAPVLGALGGRMTPATSRGAAPMLAATLAAAGALAGALGPAPAAGCPLLAVAGYRLPAVAAGLRARASRRALHAALPETADLLAVSMNAGLNVSLALRRTALHAPDPIRSELDRVNGEIALGRPLRQALGALADRAGGDEIRTLVSILTGADRFGSRVAGSIERWADDLWTRRRHELEAEARRAPVRILFPLVFLILPAFLLMTVVPLLLSTLRTIGY